MTCIEAEAAAVGARMGSDGDCALARPQVSEVSRSLHVSEVMFEFIPLSSAPGRIRTFAHGPRQPDTPPAATGCARGQRRQLFVSTTGARLARTTAQVPGLRMGTVGVLVG